MQSKLFSNLVKRFSKSADNLDLRMKIVDMETNLEDARIERAKRLVAIYEDRENIDFENPTARDVSDIEFVVKEVERARETSLDDEPQFKFLCAYTFRNALTLCKKNETAEEGIYDKFIELAQKCNDHHYRPDEKLSVHPQ